MKYILYIINSIRLNDTIVRDISPLHYYIITEEFR